MKSLTQYRNNNSLIINLLREILFFIRVWYSFGHVMFLSNIGCTKMIWIATSGWGATGDLITSFIDYMLLPSVSPIVFLNIIFHICIVISGIICYDCTYWAVMTGSNLQYTFALFDIAIQYHLLYAHLKYHENIKRRNVLSGFMVIFYCIIWSWMYAS